MESEKNFRKTLLWMTLTALFMGINIAMSSFGIPVPGGHLYLNDVIICTAAILVGGVGAFLCDLFFYPAPMFVSLVTHGLQAVVISVFARYIMKKHPTLSAGIGVTIGAVINVVGYSIGRAFFYGAKSYAVVIEKLPFQILQAAVGAVLAMLICFPFKLREIYAKMILKKQG